MVCNKHSLSTLEGVKQSAHACRLTRSHAAKLHAASKRGSSWSPRVGRRAQLGLAWEVEMGTREGLIRRELFLRATTPRPS